MYKLSIFILPLLLSFSSASQYDPDALVVLEAVSKKYKNLKAFKASFSQKLVNKLAQLDEERTGSILVKGSKYVLKVGSFQIKNNGTDITSFNSDINEVTISTFEPEEELVSINNVYDLYKEGYKYVLMSSHQNGNRIIELEPEDRNLPVFKIRMIINGKNEIKSFIVFERDGNQYTYNIKKFEPTEVADSYFDFRKKDYPNADIVDFR